jgi:DNA uptake protein ComE-like DNA-binding protein
MNKYKLTKTYITHDGSVYSARTALYWESDLPAIVLQAGFAVLVESDADVVQGKPADRNVIEQHVGNNPEAVTKKEPLYTIPDPLVVIEEDFVQLTGLNSRDTDLIVAPQTVTLVDATAATLSSLQYVSDKAARRVVEARDSGTSFTSMAALDAFQKLGFGRSWSETGLVL